MCLEECLIWGRGFAITPLFGLALGVYLDKAEAGFLFRIYPRRSQRMLAGWMKYCRGTELVGFAVPRHNSDVHVSNDYNDNLLAISKKLRFSFVPVTSQFQTHGPFPTYPKVPYPKHERHIL